MPPGGTPSAGHPESHAVTELPRAIGYMGATALVVGTIIGSGVFLVPHNVAQQVSSITAVLLVWIEIGRAHV
jgi:basic amino acid/polyamine antiporter, APA family